jgi:hypothetical protein
LPQQAERFLLEHPELADAVTEPVLEGRTRKGGELLGALTPALRRVHDFLVRHHQRCGVSPSYDEICDGLDLGRSNLVRLLRLLKERGYIRYIKNKARSITVMPAIHNEAFQLRPGMSNRLAAYTKSRPKDCASCQSRDRQSS